MDQPAKMLSEGLAWMFMSLLLNRIPVLMVEPIPILTIGSRLLLYTFATILISLGLVMIVTEQN